MLACTQRAAEADGNMSLFGHEWKYKTNGVFDLLVVLDVKSGDYHSDSLSSHVGLDCVVEPQYPTETLNRF